MPAPFHAAGHQHHLRQQQGPPVLNPTFVLYVSPLTKASSADSSTMWLFSSCKGCWCGGVVAQLLWFAQQLLWFAQLLRLCSCEGRVAFVLLCMPKWRTSHLSQVQQTCVAARQGLFKHGLHPTRTCFRSWSSSMVEVLHCHPHTLTHTHTYTPASGAQSRGPAPQGSTSPGGPGRPEVKAWVGRRCD